MTSVKSDIVILLGKWFYLTHTFWATIIRNIVRYLPSLGIFFGRQKVYVYSHPILQQILFASIFRSAILWARVLIGVYTVFGSYVRGGGGAKN